jgi:hypothetical protein
MSKEMRKYIDTFKQRVTESENLNISDVSGSKITKPFKSNLKVKYDSSLGMWVINGHSLQRTDVDGKTFYDKKSADDFKRTIDNQDFYFYHDNK